MGAITPGSSRRATSALSLAGSEYTKHSYLTFKSHNYVIQSTKSQGGFRETGEIRGHTWVCIIFFLSALPPSMPSIKSTVKSLLRIQLRLIQMCPEIIFSSIWFHLTRDPWSCYWKQDGTVSTVPAAIGCFILYNKTEVLSIMHYLSSMNCANIIPNLTGCENP